MFGSAESVLFEGHDGFHGLSPLTPRVENIFVVDKIECPVHDRRDLEHKGLETVA
jgi:hypothetical protein